MNNQETSKIAISGKKQRLIYDPVKEEVTISPGFSGKNKSILSTDDFLDLCFQMNWEGTRYKIETMRMNFEKTLWKVLTKQEII